MIKSALPCKLATMLPGNLQLLGVHCDRNSSNGDHLLLWSMAANCCHAPSTDRINAEMELLEVVSEHKAEPNPPKPSRSASGVIAPSRRQEWAGRMRTSMRACMRSGQPAEQQSQPSASSQASDRSDKAARQLAHVIGPFAKLAALEEDKYGYTLFMQAVKDQRLDRWNLLVKVRRLQGLINADT